MPLKPGTLPTRRVDEEAIDARCGEDAGRRLEELLLGEAVAVGAREEGAVGVSATRASQPPAVPLRRVDGAQLVDPGLTDAAK